MQIDSYSFGKIIVDGKTYNNDIIVYPDHIKSSWWRKQGHKLHLDDLKDVIEYNPEHLIIGTGNSGLMKVPEEVKNNLHEKNIYLSIAKTSKAVVLFNNNNTNTVAALHLTC